ncbi:MAG: tetratricopeptide repeat protein, partial [Maribacter sp.]
GKTVYEKTTYIGPDKPFTIDVTLATNIVEDDLEVSLLDDKGGILLQFIPKNHHPPAEGMPESLESPAAPEDIKTVEELYFIGLRLNQFYNASNPMPYYEEALRRDPGDYRVNTQLGILAIKALDWEEAETYLQTAVDRITMNYTRPKDGEALYYLGITQRALGKEKEGYDNLYRAVWSQAWKSAAYYQLAEMDSKSGETEKALAHLERTLSTNASNKNALILKGALLRKSGDYDAAKKIFEDIISEDLLNHWAMNELMLIQKETGDSKDEATLDNLKSLMRNDVESYLELATNYSNAGFIKEAKNVLVRLEETGNTYPLLYYYLGYYSNLLNEPQKAMTYYKKAATMPHDYAFPYRAESIVVLKNAMNSNPSDAKAPYYLGNLFYEPQPKRAIEMWDASRKLDDSFYIVHRNLGLAYEEVLKDNQKAMQSYEKAVTLNPNDPRLLFELDKIYEKNKISSEKKYELLKKNKETSGMRTETLLRFATRALEVGKYQEAIDIIENNTFPQLEGEREMQDTYLSAYTLRGIENLDEGKLKNAEADFKQVVDYPVGRFGRSRWAQFNYLLGTTLEKMGEKDNANEYFNKTAAMKIPFSGADTEYMYYRGLALQEIGDKEAASELFNKMLEYTQSKNNDTFFTQFEGGQSEDYQAATQHYLAGLAYQGLNDVPKAENAFKKALEYNPSHVWAQFHLEQLR